MKETLSYNIHDILTLRINRNKGYDFGDLFRLKFSSFQVESVTGPDITLNIGRFTPANRGCYVIDHKYYIKENYLYCRDSAGKASWEVEITGLEQGDTTVNLKVANRCRRQPLDMVYVPLFLPQAFLLRIIERKLAARGCFLAHAAAVAKGGQAYLLCGRAGCFKTTLCMEFVRRAGFTWLGDDQVILHQGKVLGFTLNPLMFEFMARHLPDETCWGLPDKLRFLAGYMFGRRGAAELEPGSARLKAILLMTRGSARNGESKALFSPIPQSQSGQVIDSLITNSKLEDFKGLAGFGITSAPFLCYMLAYSFVFPDSLMAAQEGKLAEGLAGSLNQLPMYRVEMPTTYRPAIFEQFHQFLLHATEHTGATNARAAACLSPGYPRGMETE